MQWWVARNDYAAIDRTVRRWAPQWENADTTAVKKAYRDGGLRPALAYYWAIPRGRDSARLLARKTQAHTLCIAGRTDGAADPRIFGGREIGFLGDYELLWVDAGHFPQNEQTEQVNRAILAWFAKYAVPSPGEG
jgi:pimeloyl-ACP methyl ester carboxylesterase